MKFKKIILLFFITLLVININDAYSLDSEGIWIRYYNPNLSAVRLNLSTKYNSVRFTKPSDWEAVSIDSINIEWAASTDKTIKLCFWQNYNYDSDTYWPSDSPLVSDIKTLYLTHVNWNDNKWDVSSYNWETNNSQFFIGFERIGSVATLIADGNSQPENRSYYRYEKDNWKKEQENIANYHIGVYVTKIPTVDVNQKNKFSPNDFVLFQNYPNPFNPATTINYSIPKQTNVTLKVFDVLGNVVATLVNEQKRPGYYEVKFDAAYLSSGVYYYRVSAGTFIQTKKMILLR